VSSWLAWVDLFPNWVCCIPPIRVSNREDLNVDRRAEYKTKPRYQKKSRCSPHDDSGLPAELKHPKRRAYLFNELGGGAIHCKEDEKVKKSCLFLVESPTAGQYSPLGARVFEVGSTWELGFVQNLQSVTVYQGGEGGQRGLRSEESSAAVYGKLPRILSLCLTVSPQPAPDEQFHLPGGRVVGHEQEQKEKRRRKKVFLFSSPPSFSAPSIPARTLARLSPSCDSDHVLPW